MNAEFQAFFDQAPPETRTLLDQLHALIVAEYPEAQTRISYGVPTYQIGKARVYIGYWKGGASMYGATFADEFARELPRMRTGKGTIQFRHGDPLPLDAIRRAVRAVLG